MLENCGGTGLALTFIRNLVRDLEKELGDIADVSTFHRFCKRQLYQHPVEGLEEGWHHYPPLLDLLPYDMRLLGRSATKRAIERSLHTFDDSGGLITETLMLASYYNAVSHTDLVYRGLAHFRHNEDQIPDYPLIVVDEYQDFSHLETSFIALLATKSKVLIAGDDDQALYGFKSASPQFIRDLAADEAYENFELPFCSRCTNVIVAAVNEVLRVAIGSGHLDDRLEKPFECYVPKKQAESEAHPKIIHARCTVERNDNPLVGRYVCEQISQIPLEDIHESAEEGYPTVLVIGPKPFPKRAHDVIKEQFPHAELKLSEPLSIDLLEGYRYLAVDASSRLGWRIVIYCEPFPDADQALTDVLTHELELVDELPEGYREHHLEIAELLQRLLAEEELGAEEVKQLCGAVGLTLEELEDALSLAEGDENEREAGEQGTLLDAGETPQDQPAIICTSLVGAKGLSAGYVYMVGMNDGNIPQHPSDPTDAEICSFLVGLSRTRKECHVVSCKSFGLKRNLRESKFVRWISEHTEEVAINAAYFK